MGIGSLGELRISKNKIDRIEDFSLPNAVGRLILKGNHILDIPSPRALSKLDAERVCMKCREILLVVLDPNPRLVTPSVGSVKAFELHH